MSLNVILCKKQGYPNERVYLAGKDSNDKTIYIAEDGVSHHNHRRKKEGRMASQSGISETPTQQHQQTKEDITISLMNTLVEKLDILIKEKQKQK